MILFRISALSCHRFDISTVLGLKVVWLLDTSHHTISAIFFVAVSHFADADLVLGVLWLTGCAKAAYPWFVLLHA